VQGIEVSLPDTCSQSARIFFRKCFHKIYRNIQGWILLICHTLLISPLLHHPAPGPHNFT
jgi:hypothetical protein